MHDDVLPRLWILLSEATPGPWRHAQHGAHEVEAEPNVLVADCGTVGQAAADAELISLLRNHGPALIQVARAAQKLLYDAERARACQRAHAEGAQTAGSPKMSPATVQAITLALQEPLENLLKESE